MIIVEKRYARPEYDWYRMLLPVKLRNIFRFLQILNVSGESAPYAAAFHDRYRQSKQEISILRHHAG